MLSVVKSVLSVIEYVLSVVESVLSVVESVSCSYSTDDAHNETSILSFFEDSSQPVYSETDEKSIVVNGITHGNGVTGDDSAEVDEALVNGEEEEWRDVEKVAAETVAVATEEASPVPNLVEVQIVEESDESREERERKEEEEEEQVGETEETRVEEEKEEEEEEEEAVQFIRGLWEILWCREQQLTQVLEENKCSCIMSQYMCLM